MENRRSISRFLGGSLLVLGSLGLAGCGSEGIPPEEKEAINLGVNADIGGVDFGNLLIVSRAESQPGRLIGVLLNSSDQPVEVVFTDEDDSATVRLEPGQQYAFQENATVFDTTDGPPGGLAAVTIAVGEDSETLRLPVQNGGLDWLAPYLPEESGT